LYPRKSKSQYKELPAIEIAVPGYPCIINWHCIQVAFTFFNFAFSILRENCLQNYVRKSDDPKACSQLASASEQADSTLGVKLGRNHEPGVEGDLK